MGKAPAFQFYPRDWLNDIKLQACSLEAQGLLINLMCLMHQSEKYGYLLINGKIPPLLPIGKMLGIHTNKLRKLLKELEGYGALKKTKDGIYFCKRMVEDQALREIRRAAGKLGGNPILINQNIKQKVNQSINQNPTPSSSSSSSSSNSLSSYTNVYSDKQPSAVLSDKKSNHFSEKISKDLIEKIDEICKQIKTNKSLQEKKFNGWKFAQKNYTAHPQAILHVLEQVKKQGDVLKSPWAYANKVLHIESQNYNEHETVQVHKLMKRLFAEMFPTNMRGD